MDSLNHYFRLYYSGYGYTMPFLLLLLLIPSWRKGLLEFISLSNLLFACFSSATLIIFISGVISYYYSDFIASSKSVLTERAFGSNWWAYWIMITPFVAGLLFFWKTYRTKLFLTLLILPILMLERIIIIFTSFERDYIGYDLILGIILTIFYYTGFIGLIFYLKNWTLKNLGGKSPVTQK